ncbi:P-loop containing nucleoside triphosphate hydrolase protein [Zopfochytrium polystomum]|nr:P-loop containing nucleoside triphosphate hydrolase protein [Zopfochytrium polystomum]
MSARPRAAFVIGAPHSGSGKTSLTLGLIRAFARRGLVVQPFKVGPDFIDPMHHEAALRVKEGSQTVDAGIAHSARRSINLDSWMLSRDACAARFSANAEGADVCIIEGVMGLFDGRDGRTEVGSTAELAKILNLPVILVVDCWAMARSVAPLVLGFQQFDPALNLAGVVFNRTGGDFHTGWLRDAVHSVQVLSTVTVLGGVPKSDAVVLPERHLGLHMPADLGSTAHVGLLADLVEKHLDVDTILRIAVAQPLSSVPPTLAVPTTPVASTMTAETAAATTATPVRIGVARDAAFCFYYHDNLSLLQSSAGRPRVTLVPFSPLADARLPPDLDAIYLGGGYPELHAPRLARNASFVASLRDFARDRRHVVYAECGGLMYLSKAIIVDTTKVAVMDDGDGDGDRVGGAQRADGGVSSNPNAGTRWSGSSRSPPAWSRPYRWATAPSASFHPPQRTRPPPFSRRTLLQGDTCFTFPPLWSGRTHTGVWRRRIC